MRKYTPEEFAEALAGGRRTANGMVYTVGVAGKKTMSEHTDESTFDHLRAASKERSLVVTTLQALHSERVNAWKTALRAADEAGSEAPCERAFGIAEPLCALERMGAGPNLG